MDYKKMTETRQSCRAFPRRGLTRVACRLESCYNDISGQGNHGARDDGDQSASDGAAGHASAARQRCGLTNVRGAAIIVDENKAY